MNIILLKAMDVECQSEADVFSFLVSVFCAKSTITNNVLHIRKLPRSVQKGDSEAIFFLACLTTLP